MNNTADKVIDLIVDIALHKLEYVGQKKAIEEMRSMIGNIIRPLLGEPAPGSMRSLLEVTIAHDTLSAIVLGEVEIGFSDQTKRGVALALDVLCWALHHDHNTSFADNLQKIDAALKAKGYTVTDVKL